MKRLLSVCLLMLCLSFPVVAGHTVGGNFYCDCNDPLHGASGMTMGDDTEIHENETPSGEVSELEIIIDALLLMIRL